jgi:hypothetical protein
MKFFDPAQYCWLSIQNIDNMSFVCGYCNDKIATDRGYAIGKKPHNSRVGGLYICPNCQGPTFIDLNRNIFPSYAIGNKVNNLPDELDDLYEEARRCTSHNSYTASVLLCRKILMNIAVHQEAKENLNFLQYVEYLSGKGFIPPNGKHWVDHIRKKGNEANHEIALMNEVDAKELLIFTEMLLKFIYEFPNMIPPATP